MMNKVSSAIFSGIIKENTLFKPKDETLMNLTSRKKIPRVNNHSRTNRTIYLLDKQILLKAKRKKRSDDSTHNWNNDKYDNNKKDRGRLLFSLPH